MKTEQHVRITLLDAKDPMMMEEVKEHIDNNYGGVSIQHLRMVMRNMRLDGQVVMKGTASKYSSPTYWLTGDGKKQAKKDLKRFNDAK